MIRRSPFLLLGICLPSLAVGNPLAQSQQLLVVLSDGFDAPRGTLYRFERRQSSSSLVRVGSPLPVWLGRSGLGWRSDPGAPVPPVEGPVKREGDGRSPAGILPIGEMWGYAPAAPGGVKLPYHQATAQDRCVDDVASPSYNQIVRESAAPSWKSAEHMKMPTDHYKYLVVLGYNLPKARPGAGSCIFLHVAPPPQGGTAGCTALFEKDLVDVLRWLDPKRTPVIVQLPKQVLTSAIKAWQLPTELAQLANTP